MLDCITSLQNGADLLWIETEKPHIEQIAGMVDRIREVIPNAKLVYNNSPSFNWTLNFRQQVFDAWKEAGKDVSAYDRAELMSVDYDGTPLAIEADERIRTFQADCGQARRHLPPPDHAADLSHGGAVDRQPRQGIFRRPGHARLRRRTSSARKSARASPA